MALPQDSVTEKGGFATKDCRITLIEPAPGLDRVFFKPLRITGENERRRVAE